MFSHTREHSSYSLTDKETEVIQEELSWGMFAHCKQLFTVVYSHSWYADFQGPKWDQEYWGTFYSWQGAELQVWTNGAALSRAIGMGLSIPGENTVSFFNILYINLGEQVLFYTSLGKVIQHKVNSAFSFHKKTEESHTSNIHWHLEVFPFQMGEIGTKKGRTRLKHG